MWGTSALYSTESLDKLKLFVFESVLFVHLLVTIIISAVRHIKNETSGLSMPQRRKMPKRARRKGRLRTRRLTGPL